MAGSNQVRAHFGTLEQLSADQTTHASDIEGYRATLKQHVLLAVNNFDGGLGSDEHVAVMKIADRLIDEHITATRQFKTSTDQVHETFRQGGQTARTILASGT
jgi:transposase